MKKFKICVYAICKNEEKFVKKWLDSMNEADCICVLDTGSEDNTVNLLKQNDKVILKQQIITPWRFDTARNESLKLIPKDVDFCVCTDLDENFEKGWRENLEKHLSKDIKQIRYRYTWNFLENGEEGIVFFANKIHSNKDFYWKNPVHEVLQYSSEQPFKEILIKDLQLNHYADNSKSRGQYLPLLELSVKEDPLDDRNVHYLGREYYFYGMYEKAIDMLKKHLNLKTAIWKEERCASFGYIAKSYEMLNNNEQAEYYYKMALIENSYVREPFYNLAEFYFKNGNYLDCLIILQSMLNIKERQLSYISSPDCWGYKVYDLMSICNFYLSNKTSAIANCVSAIKLNETEQRLKDNLKLFLEM